MGYGESDGEKMTHLMNTPVEQGFIRVHLKKETIETHTGMNKSSGKFTLTEDKTSTGDSQP